MFNITITFREGPTIMDEDAKHVIIRRATASDKQVAEIHKAALMLEAIDIRVEKVERKS